MADKVKNLYKTFIDEGYDMEDEQTFRKNLQDPTKRRAAYDALVNDGYDMEPFSEFETNIGFGIQKSAQPTQPATQARQEERPTPQPATSAEQAQMPQASVDYDTLDAAARVGAVVGQRAATDVYQEGVNHILHPSDDANKREFDLALDKTSAMVERDPYEKELERHKLRQQAYQYVPEDANVRMGTPSEEALKRWPWLKRGEVVAWNADTGEPFRMYTDSEGNPLSVKEAMIQNAKAQITGDESQKAGTSGAVLELPDASVTGPRTVKGSLDKRVDDFLSKEYGNDYAEKTYKDKDGNEFSGVELRDRYKQSLYDNLRESVRMAHIALASGSADPDKVREEMQSQWGDVVGEENLERYLSDEEATKRDVRDYAKEKLERAYAERNLIREQMDKRGKELDAVSSPLVDQWSDNPRERDGKYMELRVNLDAVENTIKSWEAVRDADDIGVVRGLKNTLFDPKTWDFGKSDFERGIAALASRGEDRFKLAERIGEQSEAEQFEDKNTGDLYRYTKIAGQSAPYFADFIMGGGLIKAAAKGGAKMATKIAEKKALKGASKTIVKNMGVLAGDVGAAYGLAATVQGLKTAGDIMERKAGKGKYGMVTKDKITGRTYFNADISPVSWGEAIYKGATASAVENYLEMVSKHLHIGKDIVDKVLPKIGLGKVSEALMKVGRSDWYKATNRWIEKGGIGEFPEEVMEGEIAIPLNAALVGDNEMSDLLDKRQQLDIIGGIGLSVGAMKAAALTAGGIDNARIQAMYLKDERRLDKAEDVVVEVLGSDRWTKLKKDIDETTNDKLAEVLAGIAEDGSLSGEQKQAISEYTSRLLVMRGHNLGVNASIMANEQRKAEYAQIRPIGTGAYGDIYDQFKGNASEAADFLVAKGGGVAQGVFHRDELGDIDVVYGSNEAGLLHMINKHVVEYDDFGSVGDLASSINDIITNGELQNYGDNYVFTKDGYRAVVIKDEASGKYVLTAYDTTRKQSEKRRSEADATRLYQSIFGNGDGNLVPQNSASVDGKDTANSGTAQGNDAVSPYLHEDGTIHKARIYPQATDGKDAEGRDVFIVKGDLVLREDGTVDKEASNDMIVYVGTDGERHVAPASMFEGAEEPISPESLSPAFPGREGEGSPAMPVGGNEATPQRFNVDDEVKVEVGGNVMDGSVLEVNDGVASVEYYDNNGNVRGEISVPVNELARMNGYNVDDKTNKTEAPIENAEPTEEEAIQDITTSAQPNGATATPAIEEVQPTAEPMPMMKDKQGNDTDEPDFSQAEPSRAHTYIYNEAGLSRTEADGFVKANVDAAQKALDKVKKKEPKMGTSISAYKAAKAALADELTQAQRQVDYWNAVKAEQAKVVAAERAAQAEKDAAIHDAAVIEEQQRKEAEAQAAAERAAVGNENPMPAITEKWNTAPKVEGTSDEMVLPNGERVKGHYVLTESGAATPSHQSTNGFRKSEGFPMDENGNTVNDRDYERDTDAQQVTRNIASQYDSRALQTPVVVSQDGVVLSGNGRTMAGELAAQDNTDTAYNEYLKQYAQKYGFTSEQVAGMQHPRVMFVPDERMPYTAETFAKFNQQEMKSQSKTEQAVKLGKIVDDGTFNRIVRNINAFDTLGEFYNDAKAANEAIKELQAAGVITPQQMAEMYDGDGISAQGREILENTLIGKAFEGNPDAVRMITEFKSMRQSVITALSEIANNIALGEDFSLESELAEAVKLCYNARHDGYRHGERVSGFARQTTLFGEEGETMADYTNATIMRLADLLNDTRVSQLKKTLAIYNAQAHDSAVGLADMFFGGVKGKEDILKEVLQILDNGTDEQQTAALKGAVEQRKRASQVEGDTAGGRGEGSGYTQSNRQNQNGRVQPQSDDNGQIVGRNLSNDEAEHLIAWMEETAPIAPELELSPENWNMEFGADGRVTTPIAEVKMGDNQYLKIAQQGRNGKLGMVKPTLEHPAVIIEDERPALDGKEERPSAYVFVKTFAKKDGSRYYHFTSVTVSKNGLEVVISNQEKSANRISTLLQQGKVAWIDSGFSLHPNTQIKESVPLNETNKPTSTDSQPALLGINSSEPNSPAGKVTESSATEQGNEGETARTDLAVVQNAIGKTLTKDGVTEEGKPYKESLKVKSVANGMADVDLNTAGYGGPYRFTVEELAKELESGGWKDEYTTAAAVNQAEQEDTPLTAQEEKEIENKAAAQWMGNVNAAVKSGGIPNPNKIRGFIAQLGKRIKTIENGMATGVSSDAEFRRVQTTLATLRGQQRAAREALRNFNARLKAAEESAHTDLTDETEKSNETSETEQPKPMEGESPIDYAERLTEWNNNKESKDNRGFKEDKGFKEERKQSKTTSEDKRKRKNKLGVSEEEKDEALKKLRDMLLGKGGNITAGLDMKTLFEQGGTLARYYVGNGLEKFADFAKTMYEDMAKLSKEAAEQLKPYIKRIYMDLQGDMEISDDIISRMDDNKTVRGFNLETLGRKETPSPIDTAKEIVKEQEVERNADAVKGETNKPATTQTEEKPYEIDVYENKFMGIKNYIVNFKGDILKKAGLTTNSDLYPYYDKYDFFPDNLYDRNRGYTFRTEENAKNFIADVLKLAEKAQDTAGIKPVGHGDFGDIYDQFKGDARGAIAFLKEKKGGEAIGALHHKDVGDIDLVWGEEGTGKSDGYGLAKLVKYHPEVLDNLQGILYDMVVTQRTKNRVQLESETHQAAVRLTWNEKKKNWLLTAFEKKETPTSIDKTTDTGENPTDLRGDTALSQNGGVSNGKGITKSANGKTKAGKAKEQERDLFSAMEEEAKPVPEKPKEKLAGDSEKYQRRARQEHDFVADIAKAIGERNIALRLSPDAKPLTMNDVKKLAERYDTLQDISTTDLQEMVEVAMTKLTHSAALLHINGDEEKQRAGYDMVVSLYKAQPLLNARDSTRVERQQYSTPTPFGYVMGQFVKAGRDVKSVLEPSAGNGALTIGFTPNIVHVNDIDERRLANLRTLGYGKVTSQNGLLPFEGERVDAMLTNPPFGTTTEKEYDNGTFAISSLEGQMAINALNSMKDDGRAAIVIGGNTEYRENGVMKPKDMKFFGYLCTHYNVADVINLDGEMYARNGTKYPVRIILVDGRKTGDLQRVIPPVKAKARAEQVHTFDELYKRVQDDIQLLRQRQGRGLAGQDEEPRTVGGQPRGSSVGNADTAGAGLGQQPIRASEGDAVRQLGDGRRPAQPVGVLHDTQSRPGGRGGDEQPTKHQPVSQLDNGNGRDAGSISGVQGEEPRSPGVQRQDSVQDNGQGQLGRGGRAENADGSTVRHSAERERLAVSLTDEKVKYPNRSQSGTLMSLVPANQAQALEKSLARIGDVDRFMVDLLGYSSKEELFSHLAAEQIDSVALAIYQMGKGNAFIIGDMTGIGKGRQAAALIRYAVKQGKKPIFFTQKPSLFSDMYRDLCDIGSAELRPYILATDEKEHKGYITDAQGNVVYKIPKKKEKERVAKYAMEHGTLPDEYDYMITTYSQIQNGTMEYVAKDGVFTKQEKKYDKKSVASGDVTGQQRRDMIQRLSRGNYMILDESHTVAGSSGQGAYMQSLLQKSDNRDDQVAGVTFLSATFAKRPDNMPLYAMRTDISRSGIKQEDLIQAVAAGGVTLQEIMSKQLVQSGQMIRRERDFQGVTIDWLAPHEGTDKVQREQFNEVAEIFSAIRAFQDDYIKPMIDELSAELSEQGAYSEIKKGTKSMGVENAPFASKMYNLVNQLLFSLKVDAVADRAIEDIRGGFKPVISFTNTMEGFLEELPKDTPMDEAPNFSLSMLKALDGVMRYTITDADQKKTHHYYPLTALSEAGRAKYNEIRQKIMALSSDLPISPLDAIKAKLTEAGYKVGEISGRDIELTRDDEGRYVIRNRADKDGKAAARMFNNGQLDALMVNKSGSTGISLHSSTKFADTRQRVLIAAQFQTDVNDEVQMRGRIDRTGQKYRGRYEYIMSTIPAEQRLQMLFKAKLKSLDANTTSSQKSKFNEMEVVDYLNKYGDEVTWEYMQEHPELTEKLGNPLKLSDEEKKEGQKPKDGCASKIARYLPFLPVEEQEQVFKDITEAYAVKIQLLNDAGENDLEITTMPLRAETKSKRIWKEGTVPNSGNAFADNTYLEEVEVDVLKKPMKAEEVKAYSSRLANGQDFDEWRAEKRAEIQRFYGDKREALVKKQTEAAQARAQKARDKYVKEATKAREKGKNTMTDAEIAEQAAIAAKAVMDEADKKIASQAEAIAYRRDYLLRTLNDFRPLEPLVIPLDITSEKDSYETTFTPNYGTFLGFKFNKEFSPSSSTAVFATLDGRRKVELPLTKSIALNAILMQTTMHGYEMRDINMGTWDGHVPTKTRKTAYIVTGNLLQALVDTSKGQNTKGHLISYSTKDGETRQGILMPDRFKPSDLRSSAPISSKLDALRSGEKIESEDGKVSLEKRGWGDGAIYWLSVPKSKQSGGEFFTDKTLRKLVSLGEFETHGSKMRAYVDVDNIAKVLDRLSKMGVTVLQESDLKNTGNTAHENEAIYETRDRKEIRYRSANPAAYEPGVPYGEARPDRADDGARPGGVQRQADGLTRLRGNDLRADEGEFCHVERVFRESGAFNFTAGEKIESAADVAYIFTELEDAAVENAFVVMVKDGKPTVVHVGVGNFDMTMVNHPVVKLAYDRLRPDKVYFVHNHPSGNVKCSYQDAQVLKNMRSMLGTDVEGVIINLKSGKYGVFDTEMRNDERVKPTQVEGEHPIKLYSFDKQVFAPDYEPDKTLNSAEKVAAFVSSHRLGDRKKLSFLVVNNQLGVTANIHTPYINIDDSNRAAFAEDVARAITEFGGTSAFVYGDFAESKGKYGDTILDDLNKEVRRLSGGAYSVRDLVKVEGNNTKSAMYGDVFEPRAEYGKGYSEEERTIIGRAKKDGTYMNAPNGKPTKLTERQWTQVRTPQFKNWFGDWEKAARIEKLRGSEAVEITGEEYKGKYDLNRDSAKQWIKDNLRGEYTNEDTGEKISLSKIGANEVTSHGERDEAHLKSIAAIPQLIEKSIFIDEQQNEKGNDKYDSYRFYVCGLKIGGEDYTAKVVIGVKNGSRYYDHRLTQIEKGKLINSLNGLSNSVAENQNASVSVGKDTKLLSILQTNSSKVVDENGEPLPVQHGTPVENLTKFDISHLGENTGDEGVYGAGFYFAPIDEEHTDFSMYGDNILHTYLSMKNPKEFVTTIGVGAKGNFGMDLLAQFDTPEVRKLPFGIILGGKQDVRCTLGELIDSTRQAIADYKAGKYDALIDALSPIWGKEAASQVITRKAGGAYPLSVSSFINDYVGGKALAEALKKDGYDGVLVKEYKDAAPHELVAFAPNQIKSATDNNGEFSREDDSILHEAEAEYESGRAGRYSTDDEFSMEQPMPMEDESPIDYARRLGDWHKRMEESGMVAHDSDTGIERSESEWRELYHKRVSSKAAKMNRGWFDHMQPMKQLQETIAEETGKPIQPDENVYLHENHASSIAHRDHEVWEASHMKPAREAAVRLMQEIMGGNWLTKHLHRNKTRREAYKAVTQYMKSKHGLENNEYKREEAAAAARAPYDEEAAKLQKLLDAGKAGDVAKATEQLSALKEAADKAEAASRAETAGKDYSGLSAIYGKDFEQKAGAYVDKFEEAHDTADFWEKWNGATKAILAKEYEAGLISRETYDKIRGMYKYYIPLKGWAENRAEDVFTYYTTGSGDGKTPRREGRTSESDDPFVTLEKDADRQFNACARNRVKQVLLNLALNHETGLLTVRRQWYQNVGTKENPLWERADADIPENATPEEMAQAIADFEDRMEALRKNGMAQRQRKPKILPYRGSKRMEKEHTVNVVKGGREYVVYVNGDPAAAQAVNGTNIVKGGDETVSRLRRAWMKLMRLKAATLTSWNANFIPRNLSRDVNYSIQNMKAHESPLYVMRYMKNLSEGMAKMTSARMLYKDANGTLDMDDPTERMFKEFMDNGGETGYNVARSLSEQRRRTLGEINRMAGMDWWKGLRLLGGGIEFLNRSVETIVRFAAYKTSREAGRSVVESIHDAKEASVNFNKHGSGEYLNKGFRELYLFSNVTLQALRRQYENATGHPVRFTLAQLERVGFGYAIAAVCNALLQAWGDDDDKEAYEELPSWMRRSGIVLPLPFLAKKAAEHVGADGVADKIPGRMFLYLPLGPEDKVWYGMGEMLWHVKNADMPTEDMAREVLAQAAEMLPLGVHGYGGNMLVNLAPTLAQDLVALHENVNYWGKPIYKATTEWNKYDPAHTKCFAGTSKWLVEKSRQLNELTGGDDIVAGTSFNPAVAEYIFSQTGGGITRLITQTMKCFAAAGDEQYRNTKNIPVIGSFFPMAEPQGGKQGGYDKERYFEIMDEYDKAMHDRRGYRKAAKYDPAYQGKQDGMDNDTVLQRKLDIIHDYKKEIDKLDRDVREKRKYGGEEQDAEDQKAASDSLKQRMVEEVDSIMGRARR